MEIKTIIFWILLVVMAAPSFYFGLAKILGKAQKVDLFKRLGYPLWFMKLIGLGEVATAIGLLFDQTRIMAIAISAIILVGAILSHLRVQEKKQAMEPTFVLILLSIIFVFTQF